MSYLHRNLLSVLVAIVLAVGCYDSTPRVSSKTDFSNLYSDDIETSDNELEADEFSSTDYGSDESPSENEIASGTEDTLDESVESTTDIPATVVQTEAPGEARESNNDFQPMESSSQRFVNMPRVWNDVDNQYSTTAELMAVFKNSREIRLLKTNGVTITVPYDRLSDHDKNFVTEFIHAERQRQSRPSPQILDVLDKTGQIQVQ